MRQLGLEPRFDLGIRIGAFLAAFRHVTTSQKSLLVQIANPPGCGAL
jgi:hypothetical protein